MTFRNDKASPSKGLANDGKPVIARPTGLRLAQWISLAATCAIMIPMSRGIRWWLVYAVFNEPREDMAHGWFIPLFTLALFWIRRRELRAAAAGPSPVGPLLALPGLLLFVIGALGDQVRLSHIAAIWLIWTALYAIWGRRLAHEAAFAVAFLLFTMPMSFLDIFTVKLRVVIAALAAMLLNGLGIEIIRVGTGLHCLAGGGFNLDVADPCSGMRSIFALSALTAGYAYLTQRTLRGKWLLFLCAIPLAMLGNLSRILSIALVAAAFGQKVATGFYHDYSGYVTFLVAVLAMVALGEAIGRLFARTPPTASGDGPATGLGAPNTTGGVATCGSGKSRRCRHCPAWMQYSVLAAMPALVLATHLHVLRAPAPVQENDDFIAAEMPELEGYTSRIPYFCQNEHCLNAIECPSGERPPDKCPRCGAALDPVSLGEHDILPKDTRIMKRNYYDILGNGWDVSIVVNGKSRQSIHRPEICLPAQGWSIEKGRVEEFPLDGGGTLAMRCMDVRMRASLSDAHMGLGYFFANPRDRAASHARRIAISVRDRAFARRVTRWAMVTIHAQEPLADGERRRAQTAEFLSALIPAIFPQSR